MTRPRTIPLLCVLFCANVASADVSEGPCDFKEEGDSCEMSNGKSGVCDANGSCVAESDDGCSVSSVGTQALGGAMTLGALAGLAFFARRRRR